MGREIMGNPILELTTHVSCTHGILLESLRLSAAAGHGVGRTFCSKSRPSKGLAMRVVLQTFQANPFHPASIIPTETNPTPISCDIARLCLRSLSW